MISAKQRDIYYKAFCEKDTQYDGAFFTGIKTTGIFCRSTCPARKPKLENCEFFKTAQDSVLAGYRPCKRCKPMAMPGAASEVIQSLITKVEENISHKWSDEDVIALGFDPSTVRRHFKKRFGITFIGYARARRMGVALKTIRDGDTIINAQLDAAYESGSGFRDAFSKILGDAPARSKDQRVLKADWLETPLGPMLALADDHALHLLEFTDRRGLEREIETLRSRHGAAILPGQTAVTERLKDELRSYFSGTLKTFQTPLHVYGSAFQQDVMQALQAIPYGETCSYKDQAEHMGRPGSVRAIARANGMNQIAIVIPCHRVIGADGKLTGYSGGLIRKEWLLEHEKRYLYAKNPMVSAGQTDFSCSAKQNS